MTNSITPPDELIAKLRKEAPYGIRDAGVTRELCLIVAAYRAGADQELEACEEWVAVKISAPEAAELRAARRPKPPSFKEQKLAELEAILTERNGENEWFAAPIRQLLEALPND